MSHFTVLVITPERPTHDIIAKALQPYHEFECTGVNDEYVVAVDKLPEAKEAYEKLTAKRLEHDGELLNPFDAQFYRDPTEDELKVIGPGIHGSGCAGNGLQWCSKDWEDGKGYRPKIWYVPEGFKEVEVPASRIESLAEYIEGYYGLTRVKPGKELDLEGEHQYGWMRVGEAGNVTEAFDRTNPNAKWDWWQMGGRWTGYFKAKPGVSDAEVGRPGLLTEVAEEGWVDSIKKGDIDTEAMMDEAGQKAGELWDKVYAAVGTLEDFIPWREVSKRHEGLSGDALREIYWDQPACKKLQEAAKKDSHLQFIDLEDLKSPRAEYVQRARNRAVAPFAVVRDGKWAEKGEMGFWATVTNEKEDWDQQFMAIWNDVPDDHWVTVVDCHI